MKKLFCILILLGALVCLLASCGTSHHYGEWEVIKQYTCTEDGQMVRSCIDCGENQTRILPARHTEVTDEAVEATCSATGLTEGSHCSACEEIIVAQKETAKIPHAYGEDGITCTVCGFNLEEGCEHINIEILPEVESTCTEKGLTEGKKCSTCGEILVVQQEAPLKAHTEEILPAVESTCTEKGLTEGKKCLNCGEILVAQQTTPVIAHTYDDKYDETCNKCSFVRDAECAHKETEVVAGYGATCTFAGLTDGENCKKCGEIIIAQTIIPATGHSVYSVVIDPTCTATGYTIYTCVVCSDTRTDEIPALGHTEVVDEAVAPTCTLTGLAKGKHCSVCGEVLVTQTVVNALGHTEVTDKEVAATCTSKGLTEGKHCSVCETIIIAQKITFATGHTYSDKYNTECKVCGFDKSDVDLYSSDYGYNSLSALPNGDSMKTLYNQMDEVAIAFHKNSSIDVSSDNVVGFFEYASLGLNDEEAIAVWEVYKNDHPLYYWISTSVTIEGTTIKLLTESIYAKGTDRAEYNTLIYNVVEEYLSEVDLTSAYQIALAAHDKIIYAIDYAYEEDGTTPQDDIWAHNILGVFDKGSGVCEAYARTFQLLLNYCEVENIYVQGFTEEERHAWNLAKMDDGNWYWFDLTWDDTPNWMWGISYNYFCVNDSQNVNWSDFDWMGSEIRFIENHFYFTEGFGGTVFDLPSRSASKFKGNNMLLRDIFIVDGLEYAWVGHNAVQLTEIHKSGNIVIPSIVNYQGVDYEVISVGFIGKDRPADGLIRPGSISKLNGNITSVTIPATVKFICDSSFTIPTLEEINVDDDNPYFSSRDGVLFTKMLYTLIQYPLANERTEYVIPNDVVCIANQAFGDGGDIARLKKLSKLTIGKKIEMVGKNNWGLGYPVQEITSNGTVIDISGITAGGWQRIYNSMQGDKKIIISENNPKFSSDAVAIYQKIILMTSDGVSIPGHELVCVIDQSITSIHIPENVLCIESTSSTTSVLDALPNLEEITVDPNNRNLFAYDGILYDRSTHEIVAVPMAINGEVSIWEGLTSIQRNRFWERKLLTGIIIPESVSNIGNDAFYRCESLTTVVLPNTLTNISPSMFSWCSSLTSIVIPDGVTSIGNSAFEGCSSLNSVVIPDSVTSIGTSAFSYCDSLSSVVIPDSVTSIGDYAFRSCDSLSSVVIGDSVTSIGYCAFYYCDSLKDVYYTGSEEEWKAITIGSDNSNLKNATIHYNYVPEN